MCIRDRSTYVYLIAVSAVLNGMERTFSNTAAAVLAGFFIDLNFPIYDLCHFIGASRFDGAFFATFTDVYVHFRNSLTDNAYIIQIWLYTVVWASAYCNLKFMWQRHISIAFIKAFVDFCRDCVGIQKSILTGGSFAGHYRTDLCPCSCLLYTSWKDDTMDLM